MAIFASTTTSGYSDPLKAMSIKALEQRQRDLLAQQAQANQIPDAGIPTPIQGISHVVNQLGDTFRQNRADRALASQRDELASTMAGIDWEKGPTSQQLATVGRANPELLAQMLQTMAENRRAAAQVAATTRGQDVGANVQYRGQDVQVRGQDVGANTAVRGQDVQVRGQDVGANTATRGQDVTVRGQDVGAATTQRGQDMTSADTQRGQDVTVRGQDVGAATTIRGQDVGAQTATRGQDVQVRGQDITSADTQRGQDVQVRGQDVTARGQDTQERIAAAEAAAKAAATASDPKRQGEIATLGEKYARQAQAVEKLDKAVNILNNGGINTGPWARAETAAAMVANGKFGTDKDMAQRTTDFNSIVNEATIQQMSETLKGQTTNFEMEKFIEVMNNPNSSPEQRIAGINRLLNAAKIGRDLSREAVVKSGGNVDLIDGHLKGGGGGGGAGGGGVVSGITEAEALKLDVGTRYKLKDGRTGVVE